jgi:exodeoxyribonuclease VII small subunit
MTDQPVTELSFEDALAALEQIVGQLERGDVPLAESITLYERGAALRAQCDARLNEARMRVEKLRLSDTGTPTGTEPFQS